MKAFFDLFSILVSQKYASDSTNSVLCPHDFDICGINRVKILMSENELLFSPKTSYNYDHVFHKVLDGGFVSWILLLVCWWYGINCVHTMAFGCLPRKYCSEQQFNQKYHHCRCRCHESSQISTRHNWASVDNFCSDYWWTIWTCFLAFRPTIISSNQTLQTLDCNENDFFTDISHKYANPWISKVFVYGALNIHMLCTKRNYILWCNVNEGKVTSPYLKNDQQAARFNFSWIHCLEVYWKKPQTFMMTKFWQLLESLLPEVLTIVRRILYVTRGPMSALSVLYSYKLFILFTNIVTESTRNSSDDFYDKDCIHEIESISH